MHRQLHCMEALFALESRLGRRQTGFVFVMTHKVQDVTAVLAAVQRRHPVLRSRLTPDVRAWEPCCCELGHHIIVEERPMPAGDIVEVCARQLEANLERPLVGTQLLHIVVLGGRAFVCVFSHVLFDGASRLIFARDVARAAAGLDLGVEQPVVGSFIDLLHLQDVQPPQEECEELTPDAFEPIPPDCADDPTAQHRSVVIVHEFDVRNALQRCRQHNVTLNSALLVALVRAALPNRAVVVVGCPINGRKQCGLPDSELVSVFLFPFPSDGCRTDQCGYSVWRSHTGRVAVLGGSGTCGPVAAQRPEFPSHGIECGSLLPGDPGPQAPGARADGRSSHQTRQCHDR